MNLQSEYKYAVQILQKGSWTDLCYSDSLQVVIGRAVTELIDYNNNSRVINQKTNFIIAEFKQEEQK